MPPTQTTAERVCSSSDTDAIVRISARLSRRAPHLRTTARASMKLRLHLFAQQLQRLHHLLMRDLGAAIHLAQYAVESEGFLQAHQPVGDPLGRADDQFFAQRLLVGDRLQPPAARRPQLTLLHARSGSRVLEPLAEVPVEIHDAFFGLAARPLVGVGDIDRSTQEDLAVAGMPRLLPGFPVGGDVRFELLERALPHRDQHAMPELGDGRKRVGAVGGDADVGPRLLVRLGGEPDIVEAVVFAVIGEGRLGPRPLEDFQGLGKALAALAVGYAIGFVGSRKTAAPDPEDQPAAADLVDRGGLFGEPQRMTERQYLNAGSNLQFQSSYAWCARRWRPRG